MERKLRVLVVDDFRDDAEHVALLLRKAGHDVITVDNGEQGIVVARRERPDLILMDVVMPGMNGFQATRQLCRDEQTRGIPIIMVSGKDQETDRVWGLRQGARAYLTKKVDRQNLMTTIGEVMG